MARSAKRNITVAALLLVVLAASLDQMIVATALPRITTELGGSVMLPWVVTAYLLTATVAAPVYGKLGDLMGRKRVLLTALALFIAGSALCGASLSIRSLVAFRALQGLGGGGLIVVSLAMAGDIAVMRDRARILGLFGGAAAVSTVAGPFFGGVITDFCHGAGSSMSVSQSAPLLQPPSPGQFRERTPNSRGVSILRVACCFLPASARSYLPRLPAATSPRRSCSWVSASRRR